MERGNANLSMPQAAPLARQARNVGLGCELHALLCASEAWQLQLPSSTRVSPPALLALQCLGAHKSGCVCYCLQQPLLSAPGGGLCVAVSLYS